MDKRALMLD